MTIESASKLGHDGRDLRVALPRSEVRPGSIARVEIDGVAIVLLEHEGAVRALEGRCPHAGAPLEKGAVCGDRLICPWHMAEFRVADGAWLAPPALSGLRTFETRVEDGMILVDMAGRPPAAAFAQSAPPAAVTIFGGGAAATAALCTLRDGGYEGAVHIYEPDAAEPIDRTLLSKNALSGKAGLDKLPLLPPERRAELAAEYHADRVVSIDAANRSFVTESGRRESYDVALLATGGRPIVGVEGADLQGVHVLRHRSDLETILAEMPHARRIVVAGGSFISMEAASALASPEREVTVIASEALPFAKQFGETVAQAIRELHEQNGVRFRTGTRVARCVGDQRVREVACADGGVLEADLVILGFGVDLHGVEISGVRRLENGAVVVDDRLQAAPGLYAAGDVAAVVARPGGAPVRIEHWRLAQEHGMAAARTMLGAGEAFTRTPFFWSQQHGKRLDYVGHADRFDDVQIDGDLASWQVVVFYLVDGRVRAAFTCGNERATAILTALLHEKPTLEQARAAIA